MNHPPILSARKLLFSRLVVRLRDLRSGWEIDMTIKVLGIDIAKNTFQLHGADDAGKAVLKKRLPRNRLSPYVANLHPCTIVMESCGGANYWARVFQRSGHTVKLISPQFVKPFVKTNKNDANDAEAIVEAASRPSMHFVPIKRPEQQDVQSIHRVRSRLVKNRTALINEIRGLCLEYGVIIALGAARVKKSLCAVVADSGNGLTRVVKILMRLPVGNILAAHPSVLYNRLIHQHAS